MSAMVGEFLGNLCFTGPRLNTTEEEDSNYLPVGDDVDFLLEYGDVDAIAELLFALNSPESSSGGTTQNNSSSPSPSSSTTPRVTHPTNPSTGPPREVSHPHQSVQDGPGCMLPPATSHQASPRTKKPSTSVHTKPYESSGSRRARFGPKSGTTEHPRKPSGASQKNARRTNTGVKSSGGASGAGKKGKRMKAMGATPVGQSDRGVSTQPTMTSSSSPYSIFRTTPSPFLAPTTSYTALKPVVGPPLYYNPGVSGLQQTAAVSHPILASAPCPFIAPTTTPTTLGLSPGLHHDPGVCSQQNVPPSYPMITKSPGSIIASTTTYAALPFTTASLSLALPSTASCPPLAFPTSPARGLGAPCQFNAGFAPSTTALSPSYSQPSPVTPEPRMTSCFIFTQTPKLMITPDSVGQIPTVTPSSPESSKPSAKSHSGQKPLNAKTTSRSANEHLYSDKRPLSSSSIQNDIENFRNRVRLQKMHRIQMASAGKDTPKTTKVKSFETLTNKSTHHKPEDSSRSVPFQQPYPRQKKQQQQQLKEQQTRDPQEDELIDRQALVKQQQQELAKLLQQHARQQEELQRKLKEHKTRPSSPKSRHEQKMNQDIFKQTISQFEDQLEELDSWHASLVAEDSDLNTLTPDPHSSVFLTSESNSISSNSSSSLGNQSEADAGQARKEGVGEVEEMDGMLSSCSLRALCSLSPLSFMEHDLDDSEGLYHFDGYRMAPAQNGSFDFFMAETTCSEAQSDTEDSNLDSLLQQFKSPSNQEPQQCLSDVCNVSDTAEGCELMCDQSSSQLTTEDNVSRSMVTSMSGGGCDMSPGHSSAYISQSPMSVSNASVAATAGTHCDLNWPSITDDESVTEVCTSPQKGEKRKASPGASPRPRRQVIPHYQTMTPWTNDNLDTQSSFPSPSHEIPCFPLDAHSVREQGLNPSSRKSSQLSESRVAVTETVYSLTSSAAIPGYSSGQSLKRPTTSQVPQMSREKRFRKTAEALQKCGLWDIAMKTGNLIKRNAELQKEIDRFRSEATVFLKAVVQNPENKELMESLSRGVPATLGHKARAGRGGFEPDSSVTTTTTTHSRASDCNSSTTSGYASYTEGGSKQTSPT